MTSRPRLFEPGRIGTLALPNRLIMAPMGTGYADDTGAVSDQLIAYHVARAAGGVGLSITEHTAVTPGSLASPTMLALYDDRFVPGFRELCGAIHEAGGRVAVQLNHAGRQADAATVGELVAPSDFQAPGGGPMARALTAAEIAEIVDGFGAAAARAQEAGADGVELHFAHGYLGASFLSPLTNRRMDEYGGDTERRCRFAREVFAEVRRRCGDEFPVWFRVSADEFTEGGMTLREAVRVASLLEEAGAQAIHVSGGLAETARYASAPYYVPSGHLAHLAAGIRRRVGIPVIAVGKVLTPQLAEDLLARGACDFVALGRPLLADPEWPHKARAGRDADIRPCIACNRGCLQRRMDPVGVCFCLANARTGREQQWPADPPLTDLPRRVLVIGGGPAGMSAAEVLGAAGHEVELWEAQEELGGAYRLATLPPGKGDLRRLLDLQQRRLEQTGVVVHLGRTATADAAVAFAPQITIVATGAEPSPAETFPGDGAGSIFLAEAVLREPALATGRVAVVGGDRIGAETAHFLAARAHPVTLIESGPYLAPSLPGSVRSFLQERLEAFGVTCLTGAEALGVEAGGLLVVQEDVQYRIEVETVVLALARHPRAWLAEEIHARGVPHVRLVGDARLPRTAQEAIYEGMWAAMELTTNGSGLLADR